MVPTSPDSFRARNILAMLAATFLCSLAATPAQATVVGVNPDITWGISQSEVDHEVSLVKAAGVTWVRASVDLSGAEYSGPGQLNMSYLSSIDHAISTARGAGLKVLLELDRTPYWASADPGKYTDSSGMHWNHYWKYANPQDYADVVSDVVNHYKGMGVNTYEVWNEPNNPSFWPSGVNAADYAALLEAAYPAIKAADPSATVAMGGLMNQGAYEYLQGMYNAGARGSYDVANFHLYPGGDPTQCTRDAGGRPSVNSFCLLEGLRSEMVANGDAAPVWVTELGWSTCTQSYCVTPQQQASYMISADQLLNSAKYSYVQNTFYYQMRDLYWESSNSSWGSSLGMFNRDWTPKPAYTALQTVCAEAPTGQTSESGSGTGSGSGSGSGTGSGSGPGSGSGSGTGSGSGPGTGSGSSAGSGSGSGPNTGSGSNTGSGLGKGSVSVPVSRFGIGSVAVPASSAAKRTASSLPTMHRHKHRHRRGRTARASARRHASRGCASYSRFGAHARARRRPTPRCGVRSSFTPRGRSATTT